MFKFKISALLVLIMVVALSCTSRKRILYFNNIDSIPNVDNISKLSPLLIQTGDILQVTISTINRDVAALFNPVTTVNGNPAAQGYMVDRSGNIELPLIGKVYVRGKSTETINEDIKVALEKSLKNVFVPTRLLNFKVSVLGDVARPGSYNITNERVTILEALSLAGDANLTARRDDVLLIREREGKKEYHSLNLNKSDILSSPLYYLTNNDVVYVKPGINRAISTNIGVQLLPVIATAITLLVVLYNNVRR